MPDLPRLAAVFREARRLLERPDNDFTWSPWNDHEDATREIDALLAKLESGEMPRMGAIFAPTGPLQEAALASGWGDEYLALADRYDAAMA